MDSNIIHHYTELCMYTIMHLLRVFIFTLLNNARYESIAVHLVILVLNFHFHLKTFHAGRPRVNYMQGEVSEKMAPCSRFQ